MNLIDYARILARRGWIIVLLAVIAAGSAYVLSTRMTKWYRSTQKVLILPSRSDLSLVQSTTNLLYSYVEYLDSELIAQKVIDNLKLDMTAGDLKKNVTIAPILTSFVVQIDVLSTDGDLANDIAREWGNQLVLFRQQKNQTALRQDRVDAQLQDNPRYSLDSPRPLVNALAGAILGVLLGAIIVFVLEYLESSIVRRREDLERVLDIQVLATIPDMEG
jgi:capsular polysaccharide biosynthesis protein